MDNKFKITDQMLREQICDIIIVSYYYDTIMIVYEIGIIYLVYITYHRFRIEDVRLVDIGRLSCMIL